MQNAGPDFRTSWRSISRFLLFLLHSGPTLDPHEPQSDERPNDDDDDADFLSAALVVPLSLLTPVMTG